MMPRSVVSGCRGRPKRPGHVRLDRIRATYLAAVSLILVASITPTAASAASASASAASAVSVSASTESYVVEFTNARGRRQTAADESLRGTAVGAEWADAIDGFAADLSPSDVQRLRNDPDVLAVERDQPVAVATTQTPTPWGLDRIDQRSRPLSNTYSYTTTGAGVTAYVIDTGIRSTHQQFGGRVGSGYVYPGVDSGIGAEDCYGHGTHVAGTLGGTTYGVAKAVTLIPVRVLDCLGDGSTTSVIAGIDWVIAHHAAGVPAVANLSLGGPGFQPEDDAINNLIADGITVVVAAGNAQSPAPATDACLDSPARVPAAITVGAITNSSNDAVASYSNFGSCLDLFAPGSGVESAFYTSDIATTTMSGTSMATPHVAGVVARMLQTSPLSTPAQIWAEIDASTTSGVITGTRAGDPNKLLYMSPPGLPSVPLSVSATPANARVALTWLPPATDGDATILDYVVQYKTADAASWSTFDDGVSLSTSTTVTGLVNGTSYVFRVSATNALGVGPASGVTGVIAVAATVPSAPPVITATIVDLHVELSWTTPTDDGGSPISGYTASASTDGLACTTNGALSCAVTGLRPGVTYTFTVVAHNAVGPSQPSSPAAAVVLGSGYSALTPMRIFDSRPGEPQGAVAIAQQRYGGANILGVHVGGVGGVPASGAGAVSLNVTVVDPIGPGFVTVYPCGALPLASSVNFVAGATVANAVLAPLSPAGDVCFFASVDAYVLADVNGWFVAGDGFASLTPTRVFDSRPTEPQGVVAVTQQQYGGANVLRVRVAGAGGVPSAGLSAVSLNVTVVDPIGSGFVTVFPCGALPLASSVNFVAGATVANAVIAPLSAAGDVCFFASVDAYVLADVNGWFVSGSGFSAVLPARVFDSRPGEPQGVVGIAQQRYGGATVLHVRVAGAGGVPPSGAGAVSLNVTVVDPVGAGFATVFPCGALPLASSVNFVAGATVANAVIAPLSAAGEVCLFASVDTYVLADVNGWFAKN